MSCGILGFVLLTDGLSEHAGEDVCRADFNEPFDILFCDESILGFNPVLESVISLAFFNDTWTGETYHWTGDAN